MTRRRLVGWILLMLVGAGALAVGASREAGPATNDERAQALAEDLKCPTCRSQSVADSEAPASRAIRLEIDRRIEAGQTDREIKRFLTDRYGEQILLTPSSRGLTALVWIVPPVALAGAAVGIAMAVRRRGRAPTRPLTDAERARVAAALAER